MSEAFWINVIIWPVLFSAIGLARLHYAAKSCEYLKMLTKQVASSS